MSPLPEKCDIDPFAVTDISFAVKPTISSVALKVRLIHLLFVIPPSSKLANVPIRGPLYHHRIHSVVLLI